MAETATKKEFKLSTKGAMAGNVVVSPKVPTTTFSGVVKIGKDGVVVLAWNDKSIPKHWKLYPEDYTVAVESSSTSVGDGFVELVGPREDKLPVEDINKVVRKGDVVEFVRTDKNGSRNAVASLVNARVREEGDGNEYKAFKKIPVKAATGTAKKTTAAKKKTTAKKTTKTAAGKKKTTAKKTTKTAAGKKKTTKAAAKKTTKKPAAGKKKTTKATKTKAKTKKKVKK